MRGRISPKTKERFRKSMNDVIKGLSRSVLVYKQPIKKECLNCYFDKMTSKSTGKCKWTLEEAEQKQLEWEVIYPGQIKYKWFRVGRCPICKGKGYLEIIRRTSMDCLVIWSPESRQGNRTVYTPAGSEGSTMVQLKTDPKHYSTFKNCSSIVVDGVACKLSRAPIIRGLGNQSVMIIDAFTTDKIKVDSGEIIKEYT